MDWLTQVLAVERAWTMAGEAEAAGPAALDRLRAAAALGGGSAQVRVRVAGILARWERGEEARALLAAGMGDGPPPAPLQIAYARQLQALGATCEACAAYRAAMHRARPDAALMLELAEIDGDARLPAAAACLRCDDPRDMAARMVRLAAEGRAALAIAAGRIAFRRGWREVTFVAAYDALLAATGEMDDHATMAAAHQALSAAEDRTALLARTEAREASDRWVGLETLETFLRARVVAGEPFSWIRLGDGEARFLLAADRTLAPALPDRQRRAAGRVIWRNWFGEAIDDMPAELATGLATAAGQADLLGLASTPRLIHDPDHFGWCAVLDGWIERVAVRTDQRFTEALFTYPLNEADPFLARLLDGLDLIGIVSPHRDLAALLGQRLGIGRTIEHVIPGESRLSGAAGGERHWPDRFRRLMDELVVPHRGAVFLVAGGLLGKLYCQRIRELGGIALDIGALADAWMGRNTRGTSLDKAMAHTLV